MSNETFFTYKNGRWMWFSLVSVLMLIVVYLYDSPLGGPSGGTVLGYAYGVISTIGILYLMWYGIRRRSYTAKNTTLKGCLSAHVWIGLALAIVVPLHSGFSFGWNVHTFTYIVMLLTIATGVWGIAMYQSIPQHLYSQRGGGSTKQCLASINELSGDIEKMLFQAGRSDEFMKLANQVDFEFKANFWQAFLGKYPQPLERSNLAQSINVLEQEERKLALSLIEIASKKRQLIEKVMMEARNHALVRGWLFLHVPLSIGLLVFLAIHIFSVFFYW